MVSLEKPLGSPAHTHETKNYIDTTLYGDAAGEPVGLRTEDQDLGQFGYKPELKRRFGLWSMIGLSCTIMVTWEGWYTIFGVNLTDGGPAGSVYGFIFCWIGYACVVASLSELVSMVPTAGGQYHWVWELAPPKYRNFTAWITGWQIMWAWQADLAAIFYLGGTIIQAMVVLNYPDYGFQRWHGTLIMWGVVIVAVCFNTLLVKALPAIECGILGIHVLGFFVVLGPIIYFGPHMSAHDVFVQYLSLGGYSDGTAWFVGLITTVFSFLGADGAVHCVEEVRQARTAVPTALMVSVAVNGALGLAMCIAVMFTIGDLEAIETVLAPETGIVFVDYFNNTLPHSGWATGLTTLLLVLFFFCAVAVMTSTSRITWAFARDNAIPGSDWIKQVSPTFQLPLNSIAVSAVISVLLSLINIGSSVAFNAIVSMVVAAYFGSYAIPISLLVWKRVTHQHLHFGPWNMGRWGLTVNLASLGWLTITWIFSFFPIAVPVEPSSMNWSCVLWGFMMIFGLVWYFAYQRKRFTGPKVIVGSLEVH